MALHRRDFLKLSALAGFSLSSFRAISETTANNLNARVVIVGGGIGGVTAAKYLRRFAPNLQVTLIEPSTEYVTCPVSNWVIGGTRDIQSITQKYDALHTRHGVKVVHDWVTQIDVEAKVVTTKSGAKFNYDRLIVSPGIEMKWDSIEGYNEAASEIIPHAWKAGAQTLLLRKQLEAMKDGCVVMIAVPANPFRCPPGPYERASLIANYLKQYKPKSKLIILDAKDNFSKQALFIQGWKDLYGYDTPNSLIKWVPAAEDGKVTAVDVKRKTLRTEFGTHQADVLNVIPPQQAGLIARQTGLSNESGWCPVNAVTWESKIHPNVHVIGDASIAGKMPKSAFSANSQAKVCAAAVVSLLQGDDPATSKYVNTCYSLLSPKQGISVAMVYQINDDGVIDEIAGAGGVSPATGNRQLEAVFAANWYDNIMADIFA
jgi:sulfide dehydrogenase [flavocytochrome c] flavoprotein subunit